MDVALPALEYDGVGECLGLLVKKALLPPVEDEGDERAPFMNGGQSVAQNAEFRQRLVAYLGECDLISKLVVCCTADTSDLASRQTAADLLLLVLAPASAGEVARPPAFVSALFSDASCERISAAVAHMPCLLVLEAMLEFLWSAEGHRNAELGKARDSMAGVIPQLCQVLAQSSFEKELGARTVVSCGSVGICVMRIIASYIRENKADVVLPGGVVEKVSSLMWATYWNNGTHCAGLNLLVEALNSGCDELEREVMGQTLREHLLAALECNKESESGKGWNIALSYHYTYVRVSQEEWPCGLVTWGISPCSLTSSRKRRKTRSGVTPSRN